MEETMTKRPGCDVMDCAPRMGDHGFRREHPWRDVYASGMSTSHEYPPTGGQGTSHSLYGMNGFGGASKGYPPFGGQGTHLPRVDDRTWFRAQSRYDFELDQFDTQTKNNAGASLHWAVNVNKTNCQTSHSKLWWNNFCVCCYQWLLQKYSDRLDKLDWFLWQFGCAYRIPKLDRFSQPIVVEIFVDILLQCWLWLGPSCVQSIYWLLSVVFA